MSFDTNRDRAIFMAGIDIRTTRFSLSKPSQSNWLTLNEMMRHNDDVIASITLRTTAEIAELHQALGSILRDADDAIRQQ